MTRLEQYEWAARIQHIKEEFPNIHVLWSEEEGFAFLSYKSVRKKITYEDDLYNILELCRDVLKIPYSTP